MVSGLIFVLRPKRSLLLFCARRRIWPASNWQTITRVLIHVLTGAIPGESMGGGGGETLNGARTGDTNPGPQLLTAPCYPLKKESDQLFQEWSHSWETSLIAGITYEPSLSGVGCRLYCNNLWDSWVFMCKHRITKVLIRFTGSLHPIAVGHRVSQCFAIFFQ